MDLTDVLVRVIPVAFAAALSPFNITVVILMLLSKEHPAARATAFIAGFTLSLIFVGSLALAFISNIYEPPLRPRAYLVVAGLGGLMLYFGIRQILTRVDPEQPPGKWMERITKFRPFTAFWVGFFMSIFGVKTIGMFVACLGIITSAGLGVPASLIAIVISIAVIISTMLVPLIIFVAQRDRGTQILQSAQKWLEKEQHRIGGAILLVVGVALVIIGTVGLV